MGRGRPENRGKTYEEIYGLEKALEIRSKLSNSMSIAMIGNKNGANGPKNAIWTSERREAARNRALNMSPEQREAIRISLSGRKNHSHSEKMKKVWQKPEFRSRMIPHLVTISRKNNKPTNLERILAKHLNGLFPKEEIIYNYPVANCRYKVDFAIPSLMLAFEADGNYWHRNKEKDIIRDSLISSFGWSIQRFSESELISLGDEQA